MKENFRRKKLYGHKEPFRGFFLSANRFKSFYMLNDIMVSNFNKVECTVQVNVVH